MIEQGDEERTQDLQAFKALKAALPATKIGAVVALFPEIRHLQRQGHKTRAIWESLRRDGIEMSYELFRVYLGRARRRFERNAARTSTATAPDQTPTALSAIRRRNRCDWPLIARRLIPLRGFGKAADKR